MNTVDKLNQHKLSTSADYTKKVTLFSSMKETYSTARRPASVLAVGITGFSFLKQKFEDFGYTPSQAILRSCALLSSAYVFYFFDRPVTNYVYFTGALTLASCKLYKI